MKITAKMREEAAIALHLAVTHRTNIACALHGFNNYDEATEELARETRHTLMPYCGGRYDDACIEAAALLRDGWSPGDRIVPWRHR